MAVNGFTNIVTNGLVLSLDAGNLKSYPTTGITWTDLTKNGYNGTLSNCTFNSSNIGSVVFNGTTSLINFGNILSFGNGTTDSPFSVSIWVIFTSVGGGVFKGLISKDNGTQREWALLEDGNGKIRIFLKNTLNNPNTNQQSIDSTTTYIANTWYNIVSTYDGRGGSNAADGLKLYTNSVEEIPTNIIKLTYVAMSSSVANLNLGRYSTNYFGGNISNVQIYNRALSSQEVLQNYNATKWRFI
jgi:hypothetical protein